MRFTDLSNKTLMEFIDELEEVRMGASDLAKFPSTPTAQGIRAGFEAELCFNGLGGGGGDDESPEPDYDLDRRVRSIDDACDFFYDSDFNSRRTINELRSSMTEDYEQWLFEKLYEAWDEEAPEVVKAYIEANDFNFDKHVEEYLIDELGLNDQQVRVVMNAGEAADEITSSKQLKLFADDNDAYAHYAEARDYANSILESKVKEALEDQDSNYSSAKEEWEEEKRDEFDQESWLDGEYMSNIENDYGVSWPHYSYGGSESGNEYDADNARDLARNLSNSLNVRAVASSGYHSTKRQEGLWIIEPDGSLEADEGDMPAEFISPPMPLQECLTKMREFFEWAKGEGAYTNESTGLHVGVSLPGIGGNIDYVKLALFLGDKYVLDLFDRDGNTYCKSAFDKISRDITSKMTDETMADKLEMMRLGLSREALLAITNGMGHGKYTSINLKGDYVEFRSMGGANYLDTIDLVINTVQRFAMAMSIAGDPNAYKEEYAKKLYKMLDPSRLGVNTSTVEYFAKYASGQLPRSALSSFVKQVRLQREIMKQKQQAPSTSSTQPGKKYWWDVWADYNPAFRIEVVATTEQEAKEVALSKVPVWQTNRSLHYLRADVLRPYSDPM